jgi:surfactin family lipopeptide synthetase C
MIGHYTTLFTAFAADPSRCVWDGALLTAPERAAVLVEWNRTEVDRSAPARVHGLIEAQADRTPDATAASCEGKH